MGPLPEAARFRAALLRLVPRGELDGDFIPPSQTPMARAVLAGKSFEGTEAVVQNPDGKRWVARVNVAPLQDEDGSVVGAINCFQDVTREHDMRQAMERQQHTFDLAMTASQMEYLALHHGRQHLRPIQPSNSRILRRSRACPETRAALRRNSPIASDLLTFSPPTSRKSAFARGFLEALLSIFIQVLSHFEVML